MELYTSVSLDVSRSFTLQYSSSFGLSSKLLAPDIKDAIYAIYGLVRVADEIVDSYNGPDKQQLLNDLEQEVHHAMTRGFSSNPIVHAFAVTAQKYDIDSAILTPFFASMRMDIAPTTYTPAQYKQYIHGSAEVVGLLCLKVFCRGDATLYARLTPGACALGAAYQKVNFLRDIAHDYHELGRLYFPGITYDSLSEADKRTLIADIRNDFATAKQALQLLPADARTAVAVSYAYFYALLDKLDKQPVAAIKQRRVRISQPRKLAILAQVFIRQKFAGAR